jgi:hypothetical protein
MFMINFFRVPKAQTLEALQVLQVDRLSIGKAVLTSRSYSRDNSSDFGESENAGALRVLGNKEFFKGDLIFQYLLMKVKPSRHTLLLAAAFCALRTVLPWCLDQALIPNYSFANCRQSKAFVALTELNLLFFVLVNVSFYLQAFSDIKRKRQILNQLNLMANIYAEKCDMTILPTINVLDRQTMYSWRTLYALNQEYGKKFFIRHKIFIPFVIGLLLLDGVLLFIVMSYLGKEGRIQSGDKEVEMYLLLALRVNLDLLLYFIMTLAILVMAASFNESYELPTDLLRKLSYSLENARTFKYQYVFKNSGKEQQVETLPEVDSVFEALCDEMRVRFTEENFEAEIEKLLKYYRSLSVSLESERDNNILRVLGMRISKQAVARGAAVIAPLLLAMQKNLFELVAKAYCKYPGRC